VDGSPQHHHHHHRSAISEKVDFAEKNEPMRSSAKRRRFQNYDSSAIDSLSERFSSHSPFYANGTMNANSSKAIFTGAHHHGGKLNADFPSYLQSVFDISFCLFGAR